MKSTEARNARAAATTFFDQLHADFKGYFLELDAVCQAEMIHHFVSLERSPGEMRKQSDITLKYVARATVILLSEIVLQAGEDCD